MNETECSNSRKLLNHIKHRFGNERKRDSVRVNINPIEHDYSILHCSEYPWQSLLRTEQRDVIDFYRDKSVAIDAQGCKTTDVFAPPKWRP